MKKLLLAGALLGGAALLASRLRLRRPPFVVKVRRDGEECQLTVEGEQVTMPRLLEMAQSACRRRGVVLYQGNAPYKCVGGVIFTLQQAGLMSVEAELENRP